MDTFTVAGQSPAYLRSRARQYAQLAALLAGRERPNLAKVEELDRRAADCLEQADFIEKASA